MKKIKDEVDYQKRKFNYSMTIQQWIVDAILRKINYYAGKEVIVLPSTEKEVKPFPLRLNKTLLEAIEQEILAFKPDRCLKHGEKSLWIKDAIFRKLESLKSC